MSVDESKPIASPESGVSPKSQPVTKSSDYFNLERQQNDTVRHLEVIDRDPLKPAVTFETGNQDKEAPFPENASATTPEEITSSTSSSAATSRKGSIANVTFRAPYNPSLPQGLKKPHGGRRIREASPPHRRSVDFICS